MTETNDQIIDRDALQDNMINQILDDMDIKTMMAILYDNMSESYDKYSVDELIEEVKEYYPHLLEESNTNWVGRQWTIDKVSHKMGTDLKIVYCRHMIKTQLFSDSNLSELQGFMCDTMASSEMAVDWFCDRFDVSATDEVIDFVLDAHFAFFGE